MAKSTGYVFKARRYRGSAEPPATVLEDESRFGSNGAFKGDGEPDWVRNDAGFWVMDFDGDNDYVTHGVTQPSEGTFECWARFDILSSTKGASQSIISPLFLNVANDLITLYGVAFHNFAGSTPTIDTYYHYTLTWTDKTDVTTSKLFINAAEKSGSGGSGTFVLWNYLGGGSTAAYLLNGKLSPPKFKNYPLSAGEIKQVFETERLWFGI